MPADPVTLRLPVRTPFAADHLLAFLRSHTVPGVEYVRGRTYFRALRLPVGSGTAAMTLPEADHDCSAGHPQDVGVDTAITLEHASDLDAAIAQCRRLLDLDADSRAIDTALTADPALTETVRARPGLRIPGAADGAEMLIRAVLGQQVSVAGAQTAAARLVHAADDRLAAPVGELTHLFPTARAVADLGPDVIAGPRRRAQAVCAAAAAIANGSLVVDPNLTTADLTADLVTRPGIGPWTAGYVAMRLLGDPDVLLTGDLVLRAGAGLLGLPTAPRALAEYGTRWRPYRSYAGMHLWAVALAARSGPKLLS